MTMTFPFYNEDYDPDLKLVNLPKLCSLYGITQLNVLDDVYGEHRVYTEIPPVIDEIMQHDVWITYHAKTHKLQIHRDLIGVKNYWLAQLKDDIKNRRIDMIDYVYAD